MLVLHAGFASDQLWLWGETPASTLTNKTRSKKAKPLRSPLAAGEETLLAVLEELDLSSGEPASNKVLWLPSVGKQPLASSPLVAEPSTNGPTPELLPWQMPVVALNPPQAIDCLCACMDREALRPGVIVGSTLAYWTQALRFAGALVAREQFLPGVDETGTRAVWQPILAGADVRRGRQLAQAMPAACRALGVSEQEAPRQPAASLLSAFLQVMVDGLVRSGIEPPATPMPPAVGRKNAPGRAYLCQRTRPVASCLTFDHRRTAGERSAARDAGRTGPAVAAADRADRYFSLSSLLPPGRTPQRGKQRNAQEATRFRRQPASTLSSPGGGRSQPVGPRGRRLAKTGTQRASFSPTLLTFASTSTPPWGRRRVCVP